MIKDGLQHFCGKNVLLLQGPFGPFFRRLAKELEGAGASVWKVNFNGGDVFFYPDRAVPFRGELSEWPAFLKRLLVKMRIDIVLLFGDCRPVHADVAEITEKLGVELGVFEEGYIRPNYITLERYGVNGRSRLPKSPEFYRSLPKIHHQTAAPVGNSLWYAVVYSIFYYSASILLRPFFPHYRHHRGLSLAEGWLWLMSGYHKRYYANRERGIQERLQTELLGRYFLLPLQVHNDAQVLVHSDVSSVEAFVQLVLKSFAVHAPKDNYLVIKHHPLDRVYHDYADLIMETARTLDCEDRVLYIHDQHLPSLIRHSRGLVMLNSTVGMSALLHGVPVICYGRAIFNFEGLTYGGSLDQFWNDPKPGDPLLFKRFRSYLIEQTQLNGNFYKVLPGTVSGVRWNGKTDRKPAKPKEMRNVKSGSPHQDLGIDDPPVFSPNTVRGLDLFLRPK